MKYFLRGDQWFAEKNRTDFHFPHTRSNDIRPISRWLRKVIALLSNAM